MTITALSDLHGRLPKIKTPFHLLLLPGDVCPPHDHYYPFQKAWIEQKFVPWINSLPFASDDAKVVMTWGNHDYVGERMKQPELDHIKKLTNGRLVILKNESYVFELENHKPLTIFGTPYCKIFYNWAFMISNDRLAEKYSKCPDDVDIIISHDAPTINGLGTIFERGGEQAGSTVLDELIKDKKPSYFFCGHIHSGAHKFSEFGNTKMANVSFINEQYAPCYPILSFIINEDGSFADTSYEVVDDNDVIWY